MLNFNDIISTQNMIDKQHLDIRTITMGISLLDCADTDIKACARKIYDKITRRAENLVKTGELFEIYNRVNNAIGKLQTKKIVDHDFLIGERIPTANDLAADDELLVKALSAAESATKDKAKRALIADYRARFAEKTITANEVIRELSADAEIFSVFEKMGVAITTTSSDALDGKSYATTKYTIANGMLVMVTYEDGTVFILNYSTSDAQVNLNGQIHTVRGYDYVTFKK